MELYTKDPDYVNDAVNISMFPGLSIYMVPEATMVKRCWDTSLDTNTLVFYTEAYLMNQQLVALIIGWEGA